MDLRRAAPRAVLLFVAVIGTSIAVGLGCWQWERAAQKTALQAALDARSAMPPVGARELESLRPGDESLQFRRVRLEGRWLAERTVFLDNRPLNSRTGFIVVTPFQWQGGAVLVQRGWAPRGFEDRTLVPTLATPEGIVLLEGQIAPPPSRLYEFDAAASGPIRQNIDPEHYAREIGIALAPVSVLQEDAAASDGLLRDWPRPALNIYTNYGYAFQWWAMGALIAGLYVWYQLIRPRIAGHSR